MCLSFVLRGRQCCASVVAKAHLVGGGVRARVFRRDLREYPGAHYEMCARPRSGAIFGHIHACDIRCLRSAVLQPPGRTPAWCGRCPSPHGLSYALPLGAVRCLTRCPVAQDFVLRVAALSQKWIARVAACAASRRRILWVEAFVQGCSDGICANTQGHITRCKERTLIPALQTFDSSTSNIRDLRRGEWSY